MEIQQILEIQTNDSGNLSFIMDVETGELLHVNQTMEKKFRIFDGYKGKKACEIIPNYEDMCPTKDLESLEMGQLLENTFFCEVTNCRLRSNVFLWNLGEKTLLQGKCFFAPNSQQRQEAENLFEKAIALCLEILSDNSLSSPVHEFLELLGKFYTCEQVYICEFDRQNNKLLNKHLWNQGEIVEELPESNDSIELEGLIQWLNTDYSKSIINMDKNEFQSPDPSKSDAILRKNKFQNITLSKLWNKDGSLMGILGLNNRAEQMYDDRLLQAISHFVMQQFNQETMVKTLESLNETDLLTGFYNRNKYNEKLEELEKAAPPSLGVLFINMNGIRETNEYLGYEHGDKKIKKAASLLIEYFNNIFYRVTGDEFIGFVEECDHGIFQETVNTLQERLKNSQQEPLFSIGESWEEGDYSVANLIKVADAVMMINKQSYYHESFQDLERIQNNILKDLFQGIAEEEFLVYLQPQVNLETEEVVGAEALIRRFDKKNNKMIFPDKFIPLYEENAMIRHIDLFVIRKTCQMLQEWKHFGKQFPISVNLSRVTLMEHGIVDTVSDILGEYEIEPKFIIIEVTERIGIIENDVASSLVDEFKAKGFKLSLDDFGSAYSNIVTLATISVDEVKIDKSLVDNILINPKNAVIVQSMLSMCLNLDNTHTLAEGIETKEQAEFLRSAMCHLGQGYYFSRPIPSEAFFQQYISQIDT